MSGLNLLDYILKPDSGSEVDIEVDSVIGIRKEMDNVNMSLSFENQELMTSDFFESVLSMEQGTCTDGFNTGLLDTLDSELSANSENSCTADEERSTNSVSSDSGSWTFTNNDQYEMPTFCMNDREFTNAQLMGLLDQPTSSEKLVDIPKKAQPKLYIQNENNKKVFINKGVVTLPNKKPGPKGKVLRVQSLTGNGRSVLLPFNVARLKGIKILKANELTADNVILPNAKTRKLKMQLEGYGLSSPDTYDDDDSDSIDSHSDKDNYPPLILTEEEKRLLMKEGVRLPAHYPLTKSEERELKRIRRKIRNKISAQDSRKRKKEYVDGLEERVKRGSEEKKFLIKRVNQLQKQNGKLVAQMRKLQELVFSSSATKATPTTCLMIVLFSALLISLPSLRRPTETDLGETTEQGAVRRALLYSEQATNEEDTGLNMDDFLMFNKDDESELKMLFPDEENNTEKGQGFFKLIEEFGKQYEYLEKNCSDKNNAFNAFSEVCKKFENDIRDTFNTIKNSLLNDPELIKPDFDGVKNKKGYFEPDIDLNPIETLKDKGDLKDPPHKKIKLDIPNHSQNVKSKIVSATVTVSQPKKE